jgi:predicted SpoU family rRNA methylase
MEETITITGWAVDEEANSATSTVFIVIDGQIVILTLYGLTRSDVAESLNNANTDRATLITAAHKKVLVGSLNVSTFYSDLRR